MDIVAEAAKTFGRAPALVTAGRIWSFAELDADTARIASTFASAGIRQGEVVAVVAPNSPQMQLALMALLRIGAVAAPVNNRFPAGQIEGVLQRLVPKMTLLDPAAGSVYPGQAVDLQRFIADAIVGNSTDFTGATDKERPVSVIHTSASSGQPKAALHSFSNHWHSATGSAMNLPFGPGDCWLLSLPLYHVGGYSMIYKSLLGGGAIAIPPQQEPLVESLTRFHLTHLSLVPTQLYRMLRTHHGGVLLRKLKAVLLGGSAVSAPLLEKAIREQVPVYLTYGSTEMSTQVSTSTFPVIGPQGDSGAILPYREAMIAVDGEILVKGPCLFMGYLEEGRLRTARDEEGWFHTGDMGMISKEGLLTVLGRKDSMFVSGGENIHPEQIEKALTSVPGIEEAFVVPSPDMEYGMRPMAWIRISDAAAPDDDTIAAIVGALLGRLKTPVSFNHVQEWVTIAGSAKIDRGWYRKLAEEGGKEGF
ncbi:MAG: o-succinylbenzoate--CoA ligase [Chlorobiaceae bacterium]|nr:o-succinylbenzoate--CoA ligase [Chlorobiaceae bacterium]